MHIRSFVTLSSYYLVWLLIPTSSLAASLPLEGQPHSPSDNLRQYYTRAHALDAKGAQFNPDDGWQAANITNLNNNYARSELGTRSKKSKSSSSSKSALSDLGGTVTHLLNSVWNGLQGKGDSEKVKITWYTGHDLKNPSCWSNPSWAPSDDSFAAALTLQGWKNEPKCFKFLELCNGPKKCVFVRVVDSCAGCAVGSKHVDLTKSAFSQLANLNEGILNVQMRLATEPDDWFEDLWGPQH